MEVYIKEILVFLILTAVINNLLPNNSYKKYVRLFTGLILIIILIAPILPYLKMDSAKLGNYTLDIENNNELESIERKLEELGREEENNLEGDRN
ncbi:MAG: stage III sporulation protein AF [Lachnospiraceae bacterium]|nr:stage III sporulation protein AF [Lachnospiraceae bacterium]